MASEHGRGAELLSIAERSPLGREFDRGSRLDLSLRRIAFAVNRGSDAATRAAEGGKRLEPLDVNSST